VKLTEEVKAEGRALVLASNIDALMPWVRKHAPVGLDHALYERTMRMCLLAGDVARGIKMHNAVFDTYDADEERAQALLKKWAGCAVLLAIIGGLAAFVTGTVVFVRWLF
jgi:hypothetical protein